MSYTIDESAERNLLVLAGKCRLWFARTLPVLVSNSGLPPGCRHSAHPAWSRGRLAMPYHRAQDDSKIPLIEGISCSSNIGLYLCPQPQMRALLPYPGVPMGEPHAKKSMKEWVRADRGLQRPPVKNRPKAPSHLHFKLKPVRSTHLV
jgi:hypothetical protein